MPSSSSSSLPLSSSSPSPVLSEVSDSSFSKPETDDRSYHYLQLKNGLKVLLISDSQTETSAAAMGVGVGSFSDDIYGKKVQEGSESTSESESKRESTNSEVEKKKDSEGRKGTEGTEGGGGRGGNPTPPLYGLAHFCEHMLFLGTEKYPDEEEYNRYLGAHGGSSNAYTAAETTNYYFTVNSDKDSFDGALDRFAEFFISPLFTETATDRELNAVNSEYSKNIQNDGWRLHQLNNNRANLNHPVSRFTCGNIDTLKLNGTKALRQALLDFYHEYYYANLMALVILGKQDIPTLKEMVLEKFSPIQSGLETEIKRERPVYFPGVNPWMTKLAEDTNFDYLLKLKLESKEEKEKERRETLEKETLEKGGIHFLENIIHRCSLYHFKVMKVIPVRTKRELVVTWPMRTTSPSYKTKPTSFLSHIFGHESKGSLLSLLKAQGWANELGAYPSDSTLNYSNFNISIELTKNGLGHVHDILICIMFYIIKCFYISTDEELLKLWQENSNLNAMSFRFKQKVSDPSNTCVHYVDSLLNTCYEPHELLCGPYLSTEPNLPLIKEFISFLHPKNMLVSIVASEWSNEEENMETEGYLTEKWFHAKYRIEDMSFILPVLPCDLVGDIGANAGATKRDGIELVSLLKRIKNREENEEEKYKSFMEALNLPEVNPYIPTDFTLKESNRKEGMNITVSEIEPRHSSETKNGRGFDYEINAIPTLLHSSDSCNLWFLHDSQTFQQPKASIHFSLLSPIFGSSIVNHLYANLFLRMVKDLTNEESYQAELAGLYYSMALSENHQTSFEVQISGYNDKILLLFKMIVSKIFSLSVYGRKEKGMTEELFDRLYLEYRERIENTLLAQPISLAFGKTNDFNVPSNINKEERLEIIRADPPLITFEGLLNFLTILFTPSKSGNGMFFDILVYGNVVQEDAREVAQYLHQVFLNYQQPLPFFTSSSSGTPTKTPAIAVTTTTTAASSRRICGALTSSEKNQLVVRALSLTPGQVYLQRFLVPNSEETNNATHAMISLGTPEVKNHIYLKLFSLFAADKFFDKLRTHETLGYMVGLFDGANAAVSLSLHMYVQGSEEDPDYVMNRIENFLTFIEVELEKISEEDLKTYVQSLLQNLEKKPKNSVSKESTVYAKIQARSYRFTASTEYINCLKNEIAEEQVLDQGTSDEVEKRKIKTKLLNFFHHFLANGSPYRRLFISQAYSHAVVEKRMKIMNQKNENENDKEKPSFSSSLSSISFPKPMFIPESNRSLLHKKQKEAENSESTSNEKRKDDKDKENLSEETAIEKQEKESEKESVIEAYVRPSFWWGNEDTLHLVDKENMENLRHSLPLLPRMPSELNKYK